MANISITSKSQVPFAENENIVFGGKNGFSTKLGVIPVVCSSVTLNDSNVVLNIDNLDNLYDVNFDEHVLDTYTTRNKTPEIILPIYQSTETPIIGTSGYFSNVSRVSADIIAYNVVANTITISNTELFPLLKPCKFYADIFQLTEEGSNTFFIKGQTKTLSKTYNVTNNVGETLVFSIPAPAICSTTIRPYVNDLEIPFTWPAEANTQRISLTVPSCGCDLHIEQDKYTVPALEPVDEIKVDFLDDYVVSNVSYISTNGDYNASLSSNDFFFITLSSNLSSNALNSTITNISPDLEAVATDISGNTFNLTYETSSYAYTYDLRDKGIYYFYSLDRISSVPLSGSDSSRLRNIDPGYYIVKGSAVNNFNRRSATVSTLVTLSPTKLAYVTPENISVSEDVFIDTSGGASVSATITFPRLVGRDITSYEIQYRTVDSGTGIDDETTTAYSRVIINDNPEVTNVRYTVNNIKRGTQRGEKELQVRITPLNGTYRGFIARHSHSIVGKVETPEPLSRLNILQQNGYLIFIWDFAKDSLGNILETDIKEVEIREYYDDVTSLDNDSLKEIWKSAVVVDRISFPNNRYTYPVSRFGTISYLLRTRDTSGNASEFVVGRTLNIRRHTNIKVYKNYNETDPDTAWITKDGTTLIPDNKDIDDNPFTSFFDSDNGGFSTPTSSNTENANGTASGFTAASGGGLRVSDTVATYITPIRDVSANVLGELRIAPSITVSTPSSFTQQYSNLGVRTSEASPNDNVLANTGLGTFFAGSTYDSYLNTLTFGDNVYAIFNPDTSAANANTYALIANVINSDAIELGASYHANGEPTGTNAFANVTGAGNTFLIVDLEQFIDNTQENFLGSGTRINQNALVRYATENVYYANGNVDASKFIGYTAENEGYYSYVVGEEEFRYFQIKLNFEVPNPSITSVVLDDLKYEVDVVKKIFETTVEIDSANASTGVILDYSFENFVEPPTVLTTILRDPGDTEAYVADVFDVTKDNCNVVIFELQNKTEAPGNVLVVVTGI